MKKKYRLASMFSGVGGIELSFLQASKELENIVVKVVWANDNDENACITYKENFGNGHINDRSIIDVLDDNEPIPDFEILTAGFPCQAFSIAGYQNGFDDKRGNLFFEIDRILKRKSPDCFILENVKNLKTHDNGNTFAVIEDYLNHRGYHIDDKVLNAMEYGNLPQTRERIFIVGFKSKKKMDKFTFPEPIPLTKTIHNIVNTSEKKPDYYYYKEDHQYYPELKKEMKNKDTMYQWRRVYVRENKSNACPTLTANMGTGGHNVPLLIDDFGIRKLTPRETFLFQGFPKSFKLPDDMARSHLYKQAGNSVPVPVVKRIAIQMLKALGNPE